MGNVGDELGLEPLALHLLVHRLGHPLEDIVQVLGVAAQVVGHVVGVDLIAQVARGDGLTALSQLPETHGPPAQKKQEDRKSVG